MVARGPGTGLLLLITIVAARAEEPVWIQGDLAAALTRARATDRLILAHVRREVPAPATRRAGSVPPRPGVLVDPLWLLGAIAAANASADLQSAFGSPEFSDASRDFVLLEVDRARDAALFERLGCSAPPAVAVIDPAGRVLGVRTGLQEQADLMALMQTALHLRGKLGADASGLSLDAAFELGCQWVLLGNSTEPLRVVDECTDDRFGAAQLAASDLTLLANALKDGDLTAAEASFHATAPSLEAWDPEALGGTSPLWRLYGAACFGWVALDRPGLVALLRAGPFEAVLVVPADDARQADFARRLELLRSAAPPDSGDPEAALSTGRALCALGLPRLALRWLEHTGPEGDVDRLCALVLADRLPEGGAIAERVAASAVASAADKARALAAEVLMWVRTRYAATALRVRDRILALEGLPEAERERYRSWLSDAAIRAWAGGRAWLTQR